MHSYTWILFSEEIKQLRLLRTSLEIQWQDIDNKKNVNQFEANIFLFSFNPITNNENPMKILLLQLFFKKHQLSRCGINSHFYFDYRIINIRKLMEALNCETSGSMVKGRLWEEAKKSVKGNQICPIQLLEKELDIEHGTTHYKQDTHQVTVVPTEPVFLPNKDPVKHFEALVHVKPVFTLGAFLKGIEILGEASPSWSVRKSRSFPTNKFEITDQSNNSFELTSNFFGSKYHLSKDSVTYMSISFRVGCGNYCRHLDIFTLREKSHWEALEGCGNSSDLQELYSKGSNYEHISRYTNLEPTVSSQTGNATLHFSRRAIVPCVENMILCNLNGQKVMEVVKVNEMDCIFEIAMQRKMEMEKLLAILVASFDFKLGLE